MNEVKKLWNHGEIEWKTTYEEEADNGGCKKRHEDDKRP